MFTSNLHYYLGSVLFPEIMAYCGGCLLCFLLYLRSWRLNLPIQLKLYLINSRERLSHKLGFYFVCNQITHLIFLCQYFLAGYLLSQLRNLLFFAL